MTDPLKMDSNNFGKSVLFYLATIIRSKFQFVQYFSLSLNISNDIPINLRTLSFELNCQMFVRSHAKLRCERGHCACLSHVCEAPEKNTIYSKYSSVDWKIQYEKFQIISQTLFFRAFYFGEGDNLVHMYCIICLCVHIHLGLINLDRSQRHFDFFLDWSKCGTPDGMYYHSRPVSYWLPTSVYHCRFMALTDRQFQVMRPCHNNPGML